MATIKKQGQTANLTKLNLDYEEIVNQITDYDEVFEDDDG